MKKMNFNEMEVLAGGQISDDTRKVVCSYGVGTAVALLGFAFGPVGSVVSRLVAPVAVGALCSRV